MTKSAALQHPANRPAAPGRLFRMDALAKYLSLHPVTIRRLVREGQFPKGKHISEGCVVWSEAAIEAWKAHAPGPLVSMQDLCAELSLNASSIHRMIREGRFPEAKRITPGRVAWTRQDIETWKRKALQLAP